MEFTHAGSLVTSSAFGASPEPFILLRQVGLVPGGQSPCSRDVRVRTAQEQRGPGVQRPRSACRASQPGFLREQADPRQPPTVCSGSPALPCPSAPRMQYPRPKPHFWVLLQGTELDVDIMSWEGPAALEPTGLPENSSQRPHSHAEKGSGGQSWYPELSPTPQPEAHGRGSSVSSEDPLPAPRPQQPQAEPLAKAPRGTSQAGGRHVAGVKALSPCAWTVWTRGTPRTPSPCPFSTGVCLGPRSPAVPPAGPWVHECMEPSGA